MFAQKLRVALVAGGVEIPAPKAWLDQFFMRDFTGSSAFDETLAAGDGELEAGFGVEPSEARAQFEKWLRGRKMIGPEAEVSVRPA
ncbi:MAG: hypothetical protein ABSH46_13640 [Bryobacteraceae bacterium]